MEGHFIGGLGTLYQGRGETELARAHYESALATRRLVSDRRSESLTLADMASPLQHQGSVEAARETIAAVEPLLRQVDAPQELGQLLCVRTEIENGTGDTAAALATLSEAEELAVRIGSGSDSELGRRVLKLRQRLAPKQEERGHPAGLT